MVRPKFRRLEYLYLTALGCIAIAIVISQLLIQTSIESQRDDARVINVAGRQRMLSQKITKEALKIKQNEGNQSLSKTSLKKALELWKESHEGLLKGDSTLGLSGNNSKRIIEMFGEITPHFEIIYQNAMALISNGNDERLIYEYVANILSHEQDFLIGMDKIVFQYDKEASAKVQTLKKTELYLFFSSILIIALELLFVFKPLAKNIRSTVNELYESENSSKQMANELSKLYEELGRSYQDLEAVNITPESPSLYAKIDFSGNFTFISKKFQNLLEFSDDDHPKSLQNLLLTNGYGEEFVSGLMQILKSETNWSGEIKLTNQTGDFIWLEKFLIPTHPTNEIKIIARDITEFKEAKHKSREINKERIEESVKDQQYRSSLILEGQEEERKRLSRELHDGVGQMLSALKLQLESVIPSSKPMSLKMEDAKSLMKSVIQEVRRVSFNLTPTSLDDFGLVAAVRKFCEEINKFTKIEVSFSNETKFINRLESKIETNLYRIIQEAVNNALKYSKATKVEVIFSHTLSALNIEIKDNGKGFDFEKIVETGHFEQPGHGIFNMKERSSYIGGIFNLETNPEKGTQIFITILLDKND